VAVAVVLSAVYFSTRETGGAPLPAGCTRPEGGFLVIASSHGYNDSIDHGAPNKSWPVITVAKGSTVNITVCNTDTYAHGFNIHHYFDRYVESVAPHGVIHISFVANVNGTFQIYCLIPCEVHIFMQSGELLVTP
jgi:hypothetical protein